MAFWNKLKKKKKADYVVEDIAEATEKLLEDMQPEEEAAPLPEEELKQEEPVLVSDDDKKRFVRESCEQVLEIKKYIENCKAEYVEIASQLTDIQRIDAIQADERKELNDVCKNIVNLTEERNRYKNRTLTISEAEIRRLAPYEDQLVDEIKNMYDAEAYQRAIESDLTNLGDEKEKLYNEKKEIGEKQKYLKGMAKVLCVLIISLMVLFTLIYYALKVDMTFPYLCVVLLAAISSTVLFIEANKNRKDMMLTQRKINKAINLLNKVKIKYVNNINLLDYNCTKYGVKNAVDFEKTWNEYCRMKEFERRFKENTEKLNFNNNCLLDILEEHKVEDRDIWISRAIAILDDKEMVEIRHELNQKRQKLRENVEYNEALQQNKVNGISKLVLANPQIKNELFAIIKEYSSR